MDKVTRQAIKAAGGASAVAAYLQISRQAVHKWTQVPAEHVIRVAKFSGVPAEKLRPDMFRDPPYAPGAIR